MNRPLSNTLVVLMLTCGGAIGRAADPDPPPPPSTASPAPLLAPQGCPTPLPPLAVVPPGPPTGPWASLVALHNSYVLHTDTFNPGHEPLPECCIHVFADAGIYFLQPYFESNPVSTFTNHALTGAFVPVTTTRTDEFDPDPAFAPRVELGVMGENGLGTRVSWWQLEDATRSRPKADTDKTGATLIGSAPVAGVPGFTTPSAAALKFKVFNDNLRFDSHLKTTVVDWEAFQQLRTDTWTLILAGGLRYTYLSEDYRATRFNNGSGKSGTTKVTVLEDADVVAEGHSFAGVGPTVSLDASRPIGTLGFGLYGTVRSSVVLGTGKIQSYQTSQTDVVPASNPSGKPLLFTNLVFQNDGTERDDVLPITEVELGGQWAYRFRRLGVFTRVGLVGQAWLGAGNATTESGNLGFLGLTVTGGVDW